MNIIIVFTKNLKKSEIFCRSECFCCGVSCRSRIFRCFHPLTVPAEASVIRDVPLCRCCFRLPFAKLTTGDAYLRHSTAHSFAPPPLVYQSKCCEGIITPISPDRNRSETTTQFRQALPIATSVSSARPLKRNFAPLSPLGNLPTLQRPVACRKIPPIPPTNRLKS